MRPTISWADLRGARVGVWGLGVEGSANVRKLASLGVEPVLVDDKVPGHQPVDALFDCEVVVKAPGVSRYRPEVQALEARGIAVTGGLALWLHGTDRAKVACITGTKGKSTTTAVAGHLLNALGHRTRIGGNLGEPPWAVDDEPDFWVVEVSSYQACDIALSPPVVAVTSLYPDHLDWHGGDVESYYRDKLSLCSQPGAALTIANGDSELLRARRNLLGPEVQWVEAGDPTGAAAWAEPLGLLGEHNRRNALIARAVIEALGVPASDVALRAAADGFAHLESRLRPVATIDGVLFVDDSLSTNVLPTLAALDAFPDRPVALIAGGFDRGIDYTPLADGVRRRTRPTLVLTLPESGRRIDAAVADTPPCDTLDQAVRQGFEWARAQDGDGVVLLSPAAPSFGQFRDYKERAAVFTAAVEALRS